MNDDKAAIDAKTMTSFGTKLNVISLMLVAACRIPMTSPTASATPRMGPEAIMICQKAALRLSMLLSNSIGQFTYVEAIEPMVMAQPSTNTKSKSLNGSATNIGLSIIIPKDIRIDAMTRSITRKGRNSKKPI